MHTTSLGWEFARLAHVLGPTRNPLRRPIDRLGAFLTVALMIFALLSVPAAPAVGIAVYSAKSQESAMVLASRHAVPATLADTPQPQVGNSDSQQQTVEFWATATWTGAAGQPEQARVRVNPASKPGAPITLWVDSAERVGSAPPTQGQMLATAVVAGLAMVVAAQIACLLLIVVVHLIASAVATAQWRRDWEIVEPKWTRDQR